MGVSFSTVSDSFILLDACFFLDANSQPKRFRSFTSVLREQGNSLLALDLVRTEFVRTKSKTDLEKKLTYFGEIVDTILPVDQEVQRIVIDLIEDYGRDLDGVSTVDLYLAASLKRYKGLYLLTSNHRDFPTSIFFRSNIVHFELPKTVKVYAFYQYKPKKKKIEIKEVPF